PRHGRGTAAAAGSWARRRLPALSCGGGPVFAAAAPARTSSSCTRPPTSLPPRGAGRGRWPGPPAPPPAPRRPSGARRGRGALRVLPDAVAAPVPGRGNDAPAAGAEQEKTADAGLLPLRPGAPPAGRAAVAVPVTVHGPTSLPRPRAGAVTASPAARSGPRGS